MAGCGNRRLVAVARAHREEAELYRQWSVSLGRRSPRPPRPTTAR
ncbi:hypothetical protein ACFQHO_47575 [Actinomadura yumaensis]